MLATSVTEVQSRVRAKDEVKAMPKMTDSRRKKIQARQRQTRAALRREKKAAKRAQRAPGGS
jgi:hypothetical protein